MEKKFVYGQLVNFVLDQRKERAGSGEVVAVYSHTLEVRLTKDCAEYPAGSIVLVYFKEII